MAKNVHIDRATRSSSVIANAVHWHMTKIT